MPRSRSTRALGVLLYAALAVACSSGGGNPGTAVTGNVRTVSGGASPTPTATPSTTARLQRSPNLWRLVRSWWSGEAVAQVPGVSVTIENTSNTASTDTQGFFRLDTETFGPSTLLFGAPGVAARLPVTLPAGGELDLVNVDIVENEVTVGQTRIQFEGPITGVDCTADLLQVLSGSKIAFRVRLVASTSITDQNGAALSCIDLSGNASVAGTVGDNGDVTAASLVVNPTASNTPTPQDEVQGTISTLGCPTELSVATGGGNVTVNLSGSTTIKDENGASISCGDLRAGDAVDARGTLGSFGLAATEVDRVTPAATPTPGP